MTTHIVSCLAVSLLCACAARGPTLDPTALHRAAPGDGEARLVFFRTRDNPLYLARQAALSVDGEKIGGVSYGAFLVQDIGAGHHRLWADMWDMPGRCELVLDAAAGETYYFQVDPRRESFEAFAAGDLAAGLVTNHLLIQIAGGLGTVAASAYGEQCGGAFLLYPVDADTASKRLASLRARPQR